MNLAEMLTFADIGQLNRIAAHYQCDCKRNSKHELIQSILIALGQREFFEEQVRLLTLPQLRFLNQLLFDGRHFFSLEDLQAVARHSMDEEQGKLTGTPRDMITLFTKSGWLFNGTAGSNRYLFQVPGDLKERLRYVLRERFRHQTAAADEPTVYREEHHLLAEDLQLMLQFVNNHEIPLNSEGMMYRRQQQMLMEHLHIQEPLIAKGGWRFGYGRSFKDYPDRLALLYDFAVHHKWLTERGGTLKLTEAARDEADRNPEEKMIQLFRFWLKLYKGAIPNLVSLVYWVGESSRSWVLTESLMDSVGILIKPFYYDKPHDILHKRLLHMMLHLGMVRIGELPGCGTAVQMTAWGVKMSESCIHGFSSKSGMKG
ncbi:hypothetical protein Q5741_01315 [Paenibacillus sp. JX-17]|uniref:Helicase XPB/Ssl2 N-terminal domain-containing protein n=1 Tax=Paenibacillus lacisoli TaxID=3064525 RepID=A0ABT9C8P4_9BACL|nr:hypothetical protein [Paenibacillus sp. JX-17]MDO7905049.1 hypothetical protein [Paenibacillus sp. JX-17]